MDHREDGAVTMPDPLGLREFGYEVAKVAPGGEFIYAYRVRITRGDLMEYESPWEGLQATTEDVARGEARERTMHVMLLVQGGTVESLAPQGVGDDGQEVTP